MQKYNIPRFPKWSLHFSCVRVTVLVLWNNNTEEKKTMMMQQKIRQVRICLWWSVQSTFSCSPSVVCFALNTFSASIFFIPCWETTAKRVFHMVCEDPETHYGSSPARQCWESNCEIAVPEGQYTGWHVTVVFQWIEPPSHHNKWCCSVLIL